MVFGCSQFRCQPGNHFPPVEHRRYHDTPRSKISHTESAHYRWQTEMMLVIVLYVLQLIEGRPLKTAGAGNNNMLGGASYLGV